MQFAKSLFGKLVSFIRSHGKVSIAIFLGAIVLLLLGRSFLREEPVTSTIEQSPRTVAVENVATLSSGASPLTVVGSVISESEATLRAEKSGQIVSVYSALGSYVSSGGILAEFENRSERASVAQAQASVQVAEAALAKVSGGSRSEQRAILEAQLSTAQDSLAAARSAGVTTLLSAYATIDNAIPGSADSLFSNPESAAPRFSIVTSNSQYKIDLENQRISLQGLLTQERLRSQTLSVDTFSPAEFTVTDAELRSVRTFLDLLIQALNAAVPTGNQTDSYIAVQLTNITAQRTAVTGALSSLNAAKETLAAKESALLIAQKSLEQGITGGQPEDVASAEASVAQARAGLSAAYAALEKSIIRAPISGTVNSFALERGDFVQAFTPVATIANNGTLEITSFLTESDAKIITPGTSVRIEGGARGEVSRIAPAIDPITKKMEIKVRVTEGESLLTNGSSVLLSFDRNTKAAQAGRITIPITALKVGTDAMRVFTVTSENKLAAHSVVIGTLLGERVEIKDGVTSDMEIVVDARGLREGQEVSIR